MVVKTLAAFNREASTAGAKPSGFRSVIEMEETTVAAARPPAGRSASFEPDDDDLLELATDEPPLAHPAAAASDIQVPSQVSEQPMEEYPDVARTPTKSDELEEEAGTVFNIEPPKPKPSEAEMERNLSFGGTYDSSTTGTRLRLPKALSAVALVLAGAVLGIGVYYFVMSPLPVDTDGPQLTEMRAANIPLSAFEENRRNVDRDPASYIARFGADPQDCEDHYLLGRAYLLAGDYTNARENLVAARDRLSEADPTNATVLAHDIAIAISVINGTTSQSMLRKELDATTTPSQPLVNATTSP